MSQNLQEATIEFKNRTEGISDKEGETTTLWPPILALCSRVQLASAPTFSQLLPENPLKKKKRKRKRGKQKK